MNGDPSATRNFPSGDVEDALRAAGAWDFVAEMADGIDTVVGERGSRLSGGQRQRITIARSPGPQTQAAHPRRATSALDPASEAAICATLRQLRGTLTILAISHQTAILDAADRAYRLRGGCAHLIEKTPLPGERWSATVPRRNRSIRRGNALNAGCGTEVGQGERRA